MPNIKKIKAPEALLQMLKQYNPQSIQDYKNALKEIIQKITLLALWRSKFFEKAAFYGGTALRILYQLDRFSEDLDFCLISADQNFDIAEYENAVRYELNSFGFIASVEKKRKTKKSAIDSAFIKINTLQHLFIIDLPKKISPKIHSNEALKIRFEVDTSPPVDGATYENGLLLLPYPFSVKTLCKEDLFAGKVHAVLCREWKGRVKGRDWYDLIWFVSRNIKLNLNYLDQRMRQSGFWNKKEKMTQKDLLQLFDKKIDTLDIDSAKKDIINFIKDSKSIEIWSKDFFKQIVKKIIVI